MSRHRMSLCTCDYSLAGSLRGAQMMSARVPPAGSTASCDVLVVSMMSVALANTVPASGVVRYWGVFAALAYGRMHPPHSLEVTSCAC